MISNVLGVIAAPPPVSEKHAPPATSTAPMAAPAASRSFASMLQRSRGEAAPAEPAAKAAPPTEPAVPAEPTASDAASEAPADAPSRPREAVKNATIKTSGTAWTEPAATDRTPDAKRPVLRRDDDAATGPLATPHALPAAPLPPAVATAPDRAGADGRSRIEVATAAAASLPASTAADPIAAHHGGEALAAAAPADATAPAFSLGAAPTTAVPSAAAIAETATVAPPVGTPDFAEALAVQVSVLVGAGVQRAELHLNPADMGPVSVQIVVDGAQARVDFGADLAATRQAIEASLPELATALQEAGMTLHGGGVSQHASDRREAERPHGGKPDGERGIRAEPPGPMAPIQRQMAGGIDLYA